MPSLSSCSKYCNKSFLYLPLIYPDDFLKKVKEYVAYYSDIILFPMTDVTLSEVLYKRDIFEIELEFLSLME